MRALIFRRTSAGVTFFFPRAWDCAARDAALRSVRRRCASLIPARRACAFVGIGNRRFFGSANADLGSRFR